MAIQGVTNKRIQDLGGGMNTYKEPSAINDNEAVALENAITQGTSIRSIPGNVFYNTPNTDLSMTQLSGAPAMVWSQNMRTLCIFSYSDWILQVVTPTDPSAVGYNYAAIRAYNKRLGIEKTTVTTFSVSSLKDLRISGISFKLTNVYLVIWGSGVGNTETHGFKLTESDGTILEWDYVGHISNINVSFGMKTVAYLSEQRLVMGGAPTAPGVVYYSRPGSATNPEYLFDFSGTGSGATVVSTGGRISSLFSNNNNLYVGTDTEIFSGSFQQDPTTTLYRLQVTSFANSGILSHESAELVNQESFFFDGIDVRRLGYEANILAIKDSSISDNIRNNILTLPEGNTTGQYKRDTVSSSFLFPLYRLYVRSLFAEVPDVAIVYNVIDKSWSMENTQVKSSCIISYNSRQLVTTNGGLDLFIENQIAEGVVGEARRFRYVSPEYVFGDDVDYKRFTQYELFGDITDEVAATINIYVDGRLGTSQDTVIKPLTNPTLGTTTLGAGLLGANSNQNTVSPFRSRVEFFLEGSNIQIEVICEEVAYLRLNGHNFQYKFIQAYPIH